ncbi:MAG: hypothetical protein ACK8QZ_01805 [Anaerolineales bacterium]
MSASLHIVFLDSQYLGKPKSLEQVVQVFIDADFEIDRFEIEGSNISWEEYTQKPEAMMSLAYEVKELSFRAFNPKWRFEILEQIGWGIMKLGGERRAWIRTVTDNTPYFWRAEYNPASYSRFFLDIGKSLYEVLRPTFGWIDFDYGLRTTHEHIEALELPVLYWANFFGPAYVDKIGRDKILTAPAWAIEELSDDGILYVLASCPGLETDHVPVEKVKAHFSVENVRC